MGGYALRARLGEGGMGVVHLGQRPGERPVAIKVLRPHIVGDEEARRRLEREVGSLSRVRSPRVAEIVDSDPWGEIPFVATRYVPGLSLQEHVREEGPLVGDDLLWSADCLAEALEAVHAVGVVHRDVKPSNVVMEGRSPVLIDFGLARVADDARITMTGWLLGTPGFLAPEILLGEDATTASDVHSWAATVAFAATGHAPFGRGPSAAVMDRVRRGQHDLTGVDPRVRSILEDALAPDPAARPSLEEVRDRLADPHAVPATSTLPISAAPFWEPVDPPTRPTTSYVDGPIDPPAYDVPVAVGPAERLRRSLLVLAGLGVVAGGMALAPYATLLVCALLIWLLRSGSLSATSASMRRRRRGARWYDVPQALLASPWHLVAGLPGSLVLLLWSLGTGLAAALLCFAFSLGMVASLGVVGATFGLSLWWGPGGGRVRWPVHLVVDPVARRGVPWLLATLLVAALGSGLGAAAVAGTHWWPDDSPPFAEVRLPSWL